MPSRFLLTVTAFGVRPFFLATSAPQGRFDKGLRKVVWSSLFESARALLRRVFLSGRWFSLYKLDRDLGSLASDPWHGSLGVCSEFFDDGPVLRAAERGVAGGQLVKRTAQAVDSLEGGVVGLTRLRRPSCRAVDWQNSWGRLAAGRNYLLE
jgi:hypothetical protein